MRFDRYFKQLLLCSGLLAITAAYSQPSPQPEYVAAEGRVIAGERILRLSAPSGAGVVASLLVQRGDTVERGEPLATFSDLALRESELEAARAETAIAKASLQQVEAEGARSRFSLQADLDRLRAQYSDLQSLLDEQSPPRRERIEIEYEQKSLQHDIARTQALLAPLAATVQAEKAVAQARIEAALASENQAQLAVQQAQLQAPTSGRVIAINAYPGEAVGAGGVLELAPDAPARVLAEVYITDRQRVHLGAPATISGEGFAGSWQGKVVEISPRVGRNTLREQDPFAAIDRRILQVWIDLEEPNEAAQLLGAQVRVRIAASARDTQ